MIGGVTTEAKTTKKSRKKKSPTSSIVVSKGETKQYGDFLTTQLFTISEGDDVLISVEYPIAGSEKLITSIRSYIKSELIEHDSGEDMTCNLATPEALLRHAYKRDKSEALGFETIIKVSFTNSSIITLTREGNYFCERYKLFDTNRGASFLISDGKLFQETLDIASIKPYILRNAKPTYPEFMWNSLSDYISNYDQEYDTGMLSIYILQDGVNFNDIVPSEFPSPSAIVKGLIPISQIIDVVSPEAKKFLNEQLEKENTKSEENYIFKEVDIPAEFPGGLAALMKWLSSNIRYPEETHSRMISKDA